MDGWMEQSGKKTEKPFPLSEQIAGYSSRPPDKVLPVQPRSEEVLSAPTPWATDTLHSCPAVISCHLTGRRGGDAN